jgi:type I restriction enzyme M protein
MANPPFMTPKGGIRPHNRFSIKAKRSEVLFVDYIAEHLNPHGRAGVIVPEGVIFQSQTSYKKLRRMLVENYLWAVVSLPAGVFNPYSGVKTSILLLDRKLTRLTDEVLFVKISNDGFDLGAQRRLTGKNDLPKALEILIGHKHAQTTPENGMSLCVSRKRLLDDPGYNLSADRYRTAIAWGTAKWPIVRLADVCEFMTGGTPSSSIKEYYENGSVPWLVSGDIHKGEIFDCEGRITIKGVENSNAKTLPKDSVLIALNGQGKTRGTVAILRMDNATCNQSLVSINPVKKDVLKSDFLFYQLKSIYQDIRNITGDSERSGLNIPIIKQIQIPLPPTDEQERIVEELEGYRKIIEGARQIIANYKAAFKIDPTWPMKKIGDLCVSMQYGLSVPLKENGRGYKIFRMNEIVEGRLTDSGQMKRAELKQEEFEKYRLQKGDILFNRTNSFEHVGRTGIFSLDGDYAFASYLVRLVVNTDSVNPFFLNALMNTSWFQQDIKILASRAIGQANISASNLAGFTVPVPSLDVQARVVAALDVERPLVESTRKLIEIFEAKIKAKLDEIWGKSETEVTAKDPQGVEIEEKDIAENSVSADGFPTK